MFELADQLVGIYKTFNATKSVAITPKVILQKARANAVLNEPGNRDTKKNVLGEETMTTNNFAPSAAEVGRENVGPENRGSSFENRTADNEQSMETETVG